MRTRLLFTNRTSYPDAEVKRLIRFAFADLDLPPAITVAITYTRLTRRRLGWGDEYRYALSGHAWKYGPTRGGYEVSLRLGREHEFPCQFWSRERGPGGAVANDWREALVFVAAHEGKHIESYLHRHRFPRGSHLPELRCDAYAFGRLDAWTSSAQPSTVVAMSTTEAI